MRDVEELCHVGDWQKTVWTGMFTPAAIAVIPFNAIRQSLYMYIYASVQITITDNDLIEKSNLNRQFLFRPKHIQVSEIDSI